MTAPRTTTPFPYFALVTVAVAVFLSVTTEMLPTGLLPEMSADLRVSESLIGITVSVFAFTVVVSTAALTILTRRIPRHTLVVSVLLILAVSTMLAAGAPNYAALVAARILGGLAHGVFWSVVGAYAAYLVPRDQVGRAVSISLGGGSLAFVLGVPLGTALGHAIGWRASFFLLGVLLVIGAGFVYRFLPRVDHLAEAAVVSTSTGGILIAGGESQQSHAPRRDHSVVAVVVVCVTTAIIMIGQYSFYTYVAPFLVRAVGLTEAAVSPALFAFGIAGLLSLVLVALVLGARPRLSLMVSLVVLLCSVVLLAFAPRVLPVALPAFFLWGLAIGIIPPLLQTRMLHAAPARIRDTASAFYATAFNVGIGGGALLGAVLLDTLGLASLPVVFAGILLVSIAFVLVSDLYLRRQLPRRVVDH
ncbi:MFS transporter [Frigoribacterium sp. CG_9.8]|uniref:MFS transporter n=1 Tax=Frigoribacterium sp. CG_9.8 TaxID=2787733 RepID=UPI0018CBD69B|nr:MFS transporter [Frigoribacterium sp. CG_9.8]MBG6108494.1 putative MFS family arabinose efflux permease [Frigoribacterium sp. CG_9.8]